MTRISQSLVAGVDEAGRGPLAGPVVAAAVVLPPSYHGDLIADSKTLSSRRREQANRLIRSNALAWSIGAASVREIYKHNIHQATLIAILAKVFRDHYMICLGRKYPQYGFSQHKGYPTAMHLDALKNFGPSPEHRRSFSPVAQVLGTESKANPA